MVCIERADTGGMSSSYAREVTSVCTHNQARIQAVADLLLLSTELRPISTDGLSVFRESYSKCRETIITRTKGLLVLTGRINEQLHSVLSKWHDICTCIEDMGELVIGIIECCTHAAYLVTINKPNCCHAEPGLVDHYKICRANLEIQLSCQQLKQSSTAELTPAVLVQICSDINKHLSILTDCCKIASEKSTNPHDREQFKLCVKSYSANASCFMLGIRYFKKEPTDVHCGRCVGFADSLLASTNALINFATEDEFIGKSATLTSECEDIKKSIFGKNLFKVSPQISSVNIKWPNASILVCFFSIYIFKFMLSI